METSVEGDILVIRLTGQVTAAVCPALRERLLIQHPAGVRHVHLDTEAVTAIDDAVFSVLLAAAAWLRVSGGRLIFRSASASMRRSLVHLNLTTLLPVIDGIDTAAFPQQREPLSAWVSAIA